MLNKQDFISSGVSNAKVRNLAVDSLRQIFLESLEVLLTRRHHPAYGGDWLTLMTSQHSPKFQLSSSKRCSLMQLPVFCTTHVHYIASDAIAFVIIVRKRPTGLIPD
ncbi:MAG: hypothetical protein RIM23_00755 [Coleofasciculus sp. G3-WIS-01]|uniref:hypothetical protein n=1 Tax=Coleofasciculus sp. G3-WIS-01 TaxID=3069528 RepID=UPI0032FAC273